MIVSWTEPDSGGSPLTGYIVLFIQSDGEYSSETTNCDMTNSLLTTCTVPVSALKAEPFSLDWGASVFVKVIARNEYGSSEQSLAGNGAVITVTPDSPTDLAEVFE